MRNQLSVILAVDDDPFNLDIIDEFTSGNSYQLLTAESGVKALELLRYGQTKVDIILLDRMMPGMDGLEVLHQIKQNPDLAKIPVILLTAAGEESQKAEGINAGCFYYLTKPFTRTVLNAVLSAALDNQPSQTNPASSVDLAAPLVLTHPAAHDLPGLAVTHGLEVWKKATVYRQYLRKFAHNYSDCVRKMTQAESASAASTAHKLKGSAGNLAIVDVATIATELDHILRKSLCPADCYIRLQQALDIALKSIAQYAGMELTLDNVPVVSLKREQVIPLLERLISAFNTDSPDEIEPVMVELDKHIPALRMKPIRVAVENFDFRGGEAATRSIAIELGV